jgi:hypothetical protein
VRTGERDAQMDGSTTDSCFIASCMEKMPPRIATLITAMSCCMANLFGTPLKLR